VTDRDQPLRLHPGVFYRTYGDFVVLFHTGARKVYTFSRTTADVLDCFRDYASPRVAVTGLTAIYGKTNPERVESSVLDFIELAADRGILQAKHAQAVRKNDLEARISSGLGGTRQLYSATIELTYRCNERCRHCFIVDERRPELTTEQFKSVLDDLAEMGTFNLVFTGGEIFIRKDAFEILEHAYSRGFLVDIFTNGTLLDGNDYIRLKALWPRCVHFSVYSHIPARHDAITRVRGSFEKTVKSIKSCALIGMPVNIKTTVFQETVADVAGIVQLADTLGASIEVGRGIIPRKDGNLSGTQLKVTELEDYRRVSAVLTELIRDVNCDDPGRDSGDRICGAGEHSISINPYGEVYPCNTLPLMIGDLSSSSVRQIWDGSDGLHWWRAHNYRGNRKGCGDCALRRHCIFCPGEAMMRTGDPLQMYEDACLATRLANESAT